LTQPVTARAHDSPQPLACCPRYNRVRNMANGRSIQVVGLFAGIGGLEHGLSLSGRYDTEFLCEIDPGAQAVLTAHFAGVPVRPDIRNIRSIPKVDLLTAGFPCQDLSQAGRTAGIEGDQSGLVGNVFRLLRSKQTRPKWLLLENVPFMLQLQQGRAMRYLVDKLEELGFMWAYSVVDAHAFGLPQRRHRVVLLASQTEDPRPVLFGTDAAPFPREFSGQEMCGFFWTEGLRGLGWAVDAVPTLKGGSTIGIPSPPGIWDPLDHSIGTPDIRDAERLQGFPENWTSPAVEAIGVKPGHRWKLVGNAVSVAMAKWLGERLANSPEPAPDGRLLKRGVAWPRAAWGHKDRVYSIDVSTWPVQTGAVSLRAFLRHPRRPLSYRAAAGFYSRTAASALRFEPSFIRDVKAHVDWMQPFDPPKNAEEKPDRRRHA
jgi:DNA (cytosine-5)-methyltransferase 1